MLLLGSLVASSFMHEIRSIEDQIRVEKQICPSSSLTRTQRVPKRESYLVITKLFVR